MSFRIVLAHCVQERYINDLNPIPVFKVWLQLFQKNFNIIMKRDLHVYCVKNDYVNGFELS